jgi:hypothetical protein
LLKTSTKYTVPKYKKVENWWENVGKLMLTFAIWHIILRGWILQSGVRKVKILAVQNIILRNNVNC